VPVYNLTEHEAFQAMTLFIDQFASGQATTC
jgi:hypothetical protein